MSKKPSLENYEYEYLGGGKGPPSGDSGLDQYQRLPSLGFKGIGEDIGSQVQKAPSMGLEGLKSMGKMLQYMLTPPAFHGEEFVPQGRPSFMNVPKIAGAGLQTGANILGHAPANVRDYLAEKFPEQLEGLPSLRPPESLLKPQGYDYLEESGATIGTPQEQMLFEIAKRIPSYAVGARGGPALGEFITGVGEKEDPLARSIAGGVLKEIGAPSKLTKKVGRGVAKAIEKPVKAAAKTAVKPFRAASEKVKAIKKDYLDLKKIKEETLQDRSLSVKEKDSKLQTERAIAQAFEDYIPKSKDQVKADLGSNVKDFHDAVHKEGSNKYISFESGPYGKKRVYKPIEAKFADKQYHFPEGAISETTQEMINDTFGVYKETSKRSPYTSELSFDIKKSTGNRTVAQYSRLWRQLRDEASHLIEETQSPTNKLSYGEKTKKLAAARALKKLGKDVKERMLQSVPEKGRRQFQDAQTYWDENVTPFREKSFLSNAIKHKPEIEASAFLDKFAKKGVSPLKNKMLEHEALKDAIIKHDMAYTKIKTPAQLENLLREDISSYLPKATRSQALELMKKWKTSDALLKDLEIRMERRNIEADIIKKRLEDVKSLWKKGYKGGAIALGLMFVLKKGGRK